MAQNMPYEEDMFVVMMGGLHIDMTLLKVLGDWLDGSGWVNLMTFVNITTYGRCDALKKLLFTTHSQWAHEVKAAAFLLAKPSIQFL